MTATRTSRNTLPEPPKEFDESSVLSWMEDVKRVFDSLLQDISDDIQNAQDLKDLIENGDFGGSLSGWDLNGLTASSENGTGKVTTTAGAGISQTLSDLKEGQRYSVKVKARKDTAEPKLWTTGAASNINFILKRDELWKELSGVFEAGSGDVTIYFGSEEAGICYFDKARVFEYNA